MADGGLKRSFSSKATSDLLSPPEFRGFWDRLSNFRTLVGCLAQMRRPRNRSAVQFLAEKLFGDASDRAVRDFEMARGVFEVAEGGYLWLPEDLRKQIRKDEPLKGLRRCVHDWLAQYYQLVFQASADPQALVEALWHIGRWRDEEKTESRRQDALGRAASILKEHRGDFVRYGHMGFVEDWLDRLLGEQKPPNTRAAEKEERKEMRRTLLEVAAEIRRDLTDFEGMIVDILERYHLAVAPLGSHTAPTGAMPLS